MAQVLSPKYTNFRHLITNVVYSRKLFFNHLVEIPALHGRYMRHNAMLLRYVFRPVPYIMAYKEAMKGWLGLDRVGQFGALHIRGTDKVTEEAVTDPKLFLSWWQGLTQGLGLTGVFVMTDDGDVVARLQNMSEGIRFYVSSQVRPKEGTTPAI